jgi:phosphoribosylformimino-5-aminoimidazole carboxamide ribotide isomerase
VKIYGVIDLQHGQVVHGVAGQRETYRPVSSHLATSACPGDVAHAFSSHAGLRFAYVADLDAIAGEDPAWEALESVAAAGLEVLVDAGCGDVRRAACLARHRFAGERMANRMLEGIVVGLESLAEPDLLPDLVRTIGVDRAVFSLDLRGGMPMATANGLQGESPEACAELAWRAGFRRLIVLDVAAVGVARGPVTLNLCRALGVARPWRELISGGGVRDSRDIEALANVGCHAVLVASALHHGGLKWRDDR